MYTLKFGSVWVCDVEVPGGEHLVAEVDPTFGAKLHVTLIVSLAHSEGERAKSGIHFPLRGCTRYLWGFPYHSLVNKQQYAAGVDQPRDKDERQWQVVAVPHNSAICVPPMEEQGPVEQTLPQHKVQNVLVPFNVGSNVSRTVHIAGAPINVSAVVREAHHCDNVRTFTVGNHTCWIKIIKLTEPNRHRVPNIHAVAELI